MRVNAFTGSALTIGIALLWINALGSCQRNERRELPPPPEFEMLSGEMFVVTQSRSAIRLPLVDVLAFEDSVATALVRERRSLRDSLLASARAERPRVEAALRRTLAEIARMNGLTPEWKAKYDRDEITFDEFITGDPAVTRANERRDQLQRRLGQLRQLVRGLEDDEAWAFANLPTPSAVARTNADGRFSMKLPIGRRFVLFATADRSIGLEDERYFWIVRLPQHVDSSESVLLNNDNMTNSSSPHSLVWRGQ